MRIYTLGLFLLPLVFAGCAHLMERQDRLDLERVDVAAELSAFETRATLGDDSAKLHIPEARARLADVDRRIAENLDAAGKESEGNKALWMAVIGLVAGGLKVAGSLAGKVAT